MNKDTEQKSNKRSLKMRFAIFAARRARDASAILLVVSGITATARNIAIENPENHDPYVRWGYYMAEDTKRNACIAYNVAANLVYDKCTNAPEYFERAKQTINELSNE